MKKIFSVIFVLFLSMTMLAQPYKKGDMLASVGIGYGHAGIYGSMDFPPISVGLQYGIEDKISVGGILGYSSSSDSWGSGDYGWDYTYSYIFIGARGEYHFLENSSNIDAYGGVTLGYDIVSSSVESHGTGYNWGSSSASGSYALWGLHIGARYYFNPKVSAFAELGYGVSYFTVGCAFKL